MIGKYRHRVILERKELTSDSGGGFTTQWVRYGAQRCWIAPLSGVERMQSMQLQAETTHRIVMPYRSDIKPVDRLTYKGRPLNIVSIRDSWEQGQTLEIDAVEGDGQVS